jgi:hypothetical protein
MARDGVQTALGVELLHHDNGYPGGLHLIDHTDGAV